MSLCGIRHQYSATSDFTGLQLPIDFDGLLQRKLGCLRVDSSVARHGDHLHELHARSPIRNAQRAAVRCAAVAEVVVAPAQAYECPNAIATKELRSEIDGWLHADTVED